MRIEEVIGNSLAESPKLKNVPRPIIDAVVRVFSEKVAGEVGETLISLLDDDEWHACATCATPVHLVFNGERDDGDGEYFCEKCFKNLET